MYQTAMTGAAAPARALPVAVTLTGRQAIHDGRLTRIIAAGDGCLTTALNPDEKAFEWAVVVLPQPGETVTVASTDGQVCGLWVGLRGVSPDASRIHADLLVDGQVRRVSVATGEVDARQTVSQLASDGEEAAATALFQEMTAHQETRETQQAQLDQLVDDAHTYADDNELCRRFDEFMVSHGLRPRTRDYELRVEVTATVYLTREAANAEDAADALTRDEVFAALNAVDIEWEAEESD